MLHLAFFTVFLPKVKGQHIMWSIRFSLLTVSESCMMLTKLYWHKYLDDKGQDRNNWEKKDRRTGRSFCLGSVDGDLHCYCHSLHFIFPSVVTLAVA